MLRDSLLPQAMVRIATASAYCSISLLLSANPEITRIAFGSCCRQDRPAPIFQSVGAFAPDVWIWMGVNIYGDTTDMDEIRKHYHDLLSRCHPDKYASRNPSETFLDTLRAVTQSLVENFNAIKKQAEEPIAVVMNPDPTVEMVTH